jgi:argininosuccinate lyase
VLWSSHEFGWLRLGDEVTTGSSALPHKRNPDIAELIRGRAATVIGDVAAILSLQKGLPLAYNRDLQEDKRIVFHSDDTLAGSLSGMTAMLGAARFQAMTPIAEVTTIDLAEALVGRGVPFREAHRLVGEVVRRIEDADRPVSSVTDADLAGVDDRFRAGDAELLDVARSVHARGVAESVRSQARRLRESIG